jgi:molecular chaperone IbpA
LKINDITNIASLGEYNMTAFDLRPLYRSAIGFDRLAQLLNNAATVEHSKNNFPAYNVELVEENHYLITIALAGYKESDLNITTEQNTLLVRGKLQKEDGKQYLYQGIAGRSFERRFQMADYVRVESAKLADGLLNIELIRELPEAMKPRSIKINAGAEQHSQLIDADSETLIS